MSSLIATVLGSVFIITVNILNWRKTNAIQLADQLITLISVSNLLMELVKVTGYPIKFLNESYFSTKLEHPVTFLFMFLLSCSHWFSSWLCVHFCLKIVSSRHRLYTRLQRCFHESTEWIMVLSVLGSLLCTIAIIFSETSVYPSNKTFGGSPVNNTLYLMNIWHACTIYGIVSSFGFLLSSASAVTIITSLHRHLKKMQDHVRGLQGSSVSVHVRAAKTVVSILFLNVLLYVALVITLIEDDEYIFMLTICHILGSVILIMGNKKLCKTLIHIFSRFT
uniref:Taste receptor type 2 n=1 Tax=Leptobrachium leishanense TaxID=445787 RepID=A0A8C5RAV1_9ANUR